MIVNNLYCREYTTTNEIDDVVLYELAQEINKLKAIGEVYGTVKNNKTLIVMWDYRAHKNGTGAKVKKLFKEIEKKEKKQWTKKYD